MTTALQPTPFQNPWKWSERYGRTKDGQKSLCLILDEVTYVTWGCVSEVELVWGGSATKMATPSSLLSAGSSSLAWQLLSEPVSLYDTFPHVKKI